MKIDTEMPPWMKRLLKKDGGGKGVAAERTDDWPSPYKPSVQLVPSSVLDLRARRDMARRFAIGGIGLLSLVAVSTGSLFVLESSAESSLATENAAADALQVEASALAPVSQMSSVFAQQKTSVQSQLSTSVSYGLVMQQILDAAPAGASVGSFTVVSAPAGATADPSTAGTGTTCAVDPFSDGTTNSIGCVAVKVTYEGTTDVTVARSYATAILNQGGAITDPVVSNLSSASDNVTFDLQVGFTSAALSTRFQGLDAPVAGVENTTPTVNADGTQAEGGN